MNLLGNQRPNGCVNTALGLTETEQGAFDMADSLNNDSVEIWKPVPGWEGLYEASSFGRVRSLDRLITRMNGIPMQMRGKVLKPTMNEGRGRHLSVQFRCHHRVERKEVQVVVCGAFHGPKPALKLVAAHWDGNPANNRPSNLRWATQKENMADAKRHGTLSTRANGKPDAYSAEILNAAISCFASGGSIRDVMLRYGVSERTAYRFKKHWRDHW